MKKLSAVLLACVLLFLLSSCGQVGRVTVSYEESELYTREELEEAARATELYFFLHFRGCRLVSLTYAGDDTEQFEALAEQYGADEAVVLLSSFTVDSTGGDGSLTPGETYENWQWILVRPAGGHWRHADHGYG